MTTCDFLRCCPARCPGVCAVRAFTTEQASRAWPFAEKEEQGSGRSFAFGKSKTEQSELCSDVAPQVRFELTTTRLTAGCSTIELLRIIRNQNNYDPYDCEFILSYTLLKINTEIRLAIVENYGSFTRLPSTNPVWFPTFTFHHFPWRATSVTAWFLESVPSSNSAARLFRL